MILTPPLIHWLQTAEARLTLAQLTENPPTDRELIATITQLRTRFDRDQTAALVEMGRLRRKAEMKFADKASVLYFTSEALQQASDWLVAQHTADRFQDCEVACDLGCGLGSDSLAMAMAGIQVLAVDRDPLRLALIQANRLALHQQSRIQPLLADILEPAWLSVSTWADPGRRAGVRRLFDPEQLSPPLSSLVQYQRRHHLPMGIKLMPGLPHQAIPDGAESEWISLHGDLKECVLWLGDLARTSHRIATILPSGMSIAATGVKAEIRSPGTYLYEPDPAVIRCGAIGEVAEILCGWQFDPHIAYLSSDKAQDTPLARCWQILEYGPFELKDLNRRLRARKGRVVAVKKRGSPVEPETFRQRLYAHPEGRPHVVVLTRIADRPSMLICTPPLFRQTTSPPA